MSRPVTVNYPAIVWAINSMVTRHPAIREVANRIDWISLDATEQRARELHRYLALLTKHGESRILIGAPTILGYSEPYGRIAMELRFNKNDVKHAYLDEDNLRLNCRLVTTRTDCFGGAPLMSGLIETRIRFELGGFYQAADRLRMLAVVSFTFDESLSPELLAPNSVQLAGEVIAMIARAINDVESGREPAESIDLLCEKEREICYPIAHDLQMLANIG